MHLSDIAPLRLQNQQITNTNFTTPSEMVHWLGAVQAQDYNMAKWAVGLRLPGSTNEQIEAALNNGHIIRTHILRPTWHLVAASDIRWMLELTAPHLKRIAAGYNRKLELDTPLFLKIFDLLTQALANQQELSRPELMLILQQAGIRTDELRSSHIMFQAEIEGLVCNGARRNKQFTYALLDEKVPPGSQTFTRPEALAELARRYFTSHGPATLPDFAWWSGLNLTDARLGLEGAKTYLLSETMAGQTYWFGEQAGFLNSTSESLYLLPAFDEFMVSYKDRTAALDLSRAKEAITGNGIFKPIVVLNGKVVGTWKPIIKKQKITLDWQLFNPEEQLNPELVRSVQQRYFTFLDCNPELV
ncbi:winged helix DNA-binding domain-containing protein [Adhaeribacter swui]|uniref:Winged helix DNA-binding domain-containing protein n=1 Tax=Adhaeribacter swui TaxID=2086471 RepID=A0A7G7G4L1_9BACT|nr:winged helix DNA-binding domain-containing protein [Adhaeribacter swui]QNF32095.1 winged helix DNA-binding domain-containing protein [Adhaeribacter swui]